MPPSLLVCTASKWNREVRIHLCLVPSARNVREPSIYLPVYGDGTFILVACVLCVNTPQFIPPLLIALGVRLLWTRWLLAVLLP